MARKSIRDIFDDPNASHAEVHDLFFNQEVAVSKELLRESIETVIIWQLNRHEWRGAPIHEAKEMALLAIHMISREFEADPEAVLACLIYVATKGLPASLATLAFARLAQKIGPNHPALKNIIKNCESEETRNWLKHDLALLKSGVDP